MLEPRRMAVRAAARRIAEEWRWKVGGQIGFQHAPVVERLGPGGGVVGDAVFAQTGRDGGLDESAGVPLGVLAERRVSVIIGWHERFSGTVDRLALPCLSDRDTRFPHGIKVPNEWQR